MDKVNFEHGGYKTKYHISKTDGTPIDPNANYFVLRLDKDPNALVALAAYADSVSKVNEVLAADLHWMLEEIHKGRKTSQLINKEKGRLYATVLEDKPKIEKLENTRTIKVGDLILGFHLVKSSNVEAIAYYAKQEKSEDLRDIIFVLFQGNKMYAYQTTGDARSHFQAMLEPATSVGSYCHKLKGFGFESIAVPYDIVTLDYVPEVPKTYPMIDNFASYQYHATKTAIYDKSIAEAFPNLPEGAAKLLAVSYAGLGLGEAGEIQNKLKKIIRDSAGIITGKIKQDIAGELGDIMWYVNALCKEFDLSLQEVAQGNINKLFDRLDRGKIKGSGDDR